MPCAKPNDLRLVFVKRSRQPTKRLIASRHKAAGIMLQHSEIGKDDIAVSSQMANFLMCWHEYEAQL